MVDPQIKALADQVQANTVQIQTESLARAVADEGLAKRVGSLEAVLASQLQSNDWVQGLSGWMINQSTGEFEINSAKIQVGSLPSDPQLISVTAGTWPESDLPANAFGRYAFIGAELAKIPIECRESAEFTTEDLSSDCDGSDMRTTLTYERRETAEEAKVRSEKAKVAGTRICLSNGVLTVVHDGVTRLRVDNLAKPEDLPPFVVMGETVYMNQALID